MISWKQQQLEGTRGGILMDAADFQDFIGN